MRFYLFVAFCLFIVMNKKVLTMLLLPLSKIIGAIISNSEGREGNSEIDPNGVYGGAVACRVLPPPQACAQGLCVCVWA